MAGEIYTGGLGGLRKSTAVWTHLSPNSGRVGRRWRAALPTFEEIYARAGDDLRSVRRSELDGFTAAALTQVDLIDRAPVPSAFPFLRVIYQRPA